MIEASIIIPTYNRRDSLRLTLEALFNQDYPKERYEIIVIDDGSMDGTEEMVGALKPPCRLKYLRQQTNLGQPKGRNRAIREAEGEIIISTDSDIIVVPDFIREHLSYQRKYDIVNGKLIYISDLNQVGKRKGTVFDISFSFFDTANVSVKKKYLFEAGLFDEEMSGYGWEDLEMGQRLKRLKLSHKKNPRALGYHLKERKSLVALEVSCKQARMSGINAAYYSKKHPILEVNLATRFNPLFLFAPLGKAIETPEGKRLLSFFEEKNLYLPLIMGMRLVSCRHYLEGLREGKKRDER